MNDWLFSVASLSLSLIFVSEIQGYQQGLEPQPTYEQVCAGATGHTETLFVIYDPRNCSYESLLDTFFDRVDPITVNGQGRDFGRQYRTGVYFHSLKQEQVARDRLIVEQKKIGNRRKIATECIAAMPFWPAEKYHQQYLERGGQFSSPQCAEKGCLDEIRCYGWKPIITHFRIQDKIIDNYNAPNKTISKFIKRKVIDMYDIVITTIRTHYNVNSLSQLNALNRLKFGKF